MGGHAKRQPAPPHRQRWPARSNRIQMAAKSPPRITDDEFDDEEEEDDDEDVSEEDEEAAFDVDEEERMKKSIATPCSVPNQRRRFAAHAIESRRQSL